MTLRKLDARTSFLFYFVFGKKIGLISLYDLSDYHCLVLVLLRFLQLYSILRNQKKTRTVLVAPFQANRNIVSFNIYPFGGRNV